MEDDINSVPLNPYESIPVVPPQIKSPIPKKIIILIVIVLLLISSVLFFILQKQSLKKPVDYIPITPSVTSKQVTPSISAVINEIVTLKKGINTTVPNADISLTFISKEDPPRGCADCFSTTEIEIRTKSETKSLLYVCGGIAGNCTRKLDAYGYNVELTKNLDPTVIEVKVSNK